MGFGDGSGISWTICKQSAPCCRQTPVWDVDSGARPNEPCNGWWPHWLRAQERVRFKTAVLMYKATHGTAPSYLSQHGSCRRSAWSTFPPLCSDQSSAGTVRETVYRRQPGLPSCQTHHLEQPAGQRDICPVSICQPSVSVQNISVPRLVP